MTQGLSTHWKLGPSRKPILATLMAAGRERRSFVPLQRGQITLPAPWQCSQVPVNTSVHTCLTWWNAIEKDATCKRMMKLPSPGSRQLHRVFRAPASPDCDQRVRGMQKGHV